VALLVSNGVAGAVWTLYGSTATFAVGAVLASLALVAAYLRRTR
jgi:hypothetical protein